MSLVPICSFEEMRTKLSYLSFQRQTYEPFVNTLLAENSTALLAGTLA
jgi:hypothetical protein